MSQSRTPAVRTFAQELNEATHTFKESDEERAPVFGLLPTGQKANRVIMSGTLIGTEDVGSESEYWQGEVVDPLGDSFYMYAGQYQEDPMSTLRTLDAPAVVMVVGKVNTYEKDNGEVNVSVTPEHIMEVDMEEREQWAIEAAEQTVERISSFSPEDNPLDRKAVAEYGGDISQYLSPIIDYLEEELEQIPTEADAPSPAPADD